MTTEHEQDHVIALIGQINTLLAGEDMATAETALTMTIVAMIINTAPTTEERLQQVREFANQVATYVQREDIVDWIKAGTIQLPQLGNKAAINAVQLHASTSMPRIDHDP